MQRLNPTYVKYVGNSPQEPADTDPDVAAVVTSFQLWTNNFGPADHHNSSGCPLSCDTETMLWQGRENYLEMRSSPTHEQTRANN